MARVQTVLERQREAAGRAVAAHVSRVVLFEILCDAIDVLHDLPDEVREGFAPLIARAFEVGWRER